WPVLHLPEETSFRFLSLASSFLLVVSFVISLDVFKSYGKYLYLFAVGVSAIVGVANYFKWRLIGEALYLWDITIPANWYQAVELLPRFLETFKWYHLLFSIVVGGIALLICRAFAHRVYLRDKK